MDLLTRKSGLFRAFADPTRLRILNLLADGECCVCHLCEVLEEIQPKVSRHLAYLRKAGLVRARREGRWMHYALPPRPEGLAGTLLECIRSCLGDLDELRSDRERLRALRCSCPA